MVDGSQLKIMDFGTAKLAHVESHLTQSGMTLGTVAYLPPERLLGPAHRAQLGPFSYGVLAYELLSFRRPFSGRNIPNLIDQVLNAAPMRLPDVWPECPPRLAEVVHRCLLKDPVQRYATCGDLIADLNEVASEFTGVARATTDTSTSITVSQNFQAGGMLERARQLHAQGKLQRAAVIAEEVLELEPGNQEARMLLEACQAAPAAGLTGAGLPAGGPPPASSTVAVSTSVSLTGVATGGGRRYLAGPPPGKPGGAQAAQGGRRHRNRSKATSAPASWPRPPRRCVSPTSCSAGSTPPPASPGGSPTASASS